MTVSKLEDQRDQALAAVVEGMRVLNGRESLLWARFEENVAAAGELLALARETPLVAGSTGQQRANPLFEAAARCDRAALDLWRELTAGWDRALAEVGEVLAA